MPSRNQGLLFALASRTAAAVGGGGSPAAGSHNSGLLLALTTRVAGGPAEPEVPPIPALVGFTVDGVLRAPARGSFSFREMLGSRSTGAVTVEVALADDVVVEHGHTFTVVRRNGTMIFAGHLYRPRRSLLGKSYIRYECDTVDYSAVFDHRLVAAVYENETLGDIVAAIVTDFLTEEDITVAGVEEGPVIRKVTFNYKSVTECFNELARLTGYTYWLDYDRDLKFCARTSAVSPVALSVDAYNFFDCVVTTDADEYRNVQYLRAGTDLTDPRTETFTGDGTRRTFNVDFPIGKVPAVTVNGVVKTIGIRGVTDEGSAQWFWNKGATEIGQDSTETVLDVADELAVTYQGQFPIIVVGEHGGEIAARAAIEGGSGRHERLEHDASIDDSETALDKVAALLSRFGLIADTVECTTHEDGLRAGHLISITHPALDVSGFYLIEDVSARMLNPERLEYRIRALGGNTIGAWQEFYQRLAALGASEEPRDNEVLLLLRTALDTIRVTDTLTATTTTGAETRVDHALVDFSQVAA